MSDSKTAQLKSLVKQLNTTAATARPEDTVAILTRLKNEVTASEETLRETKVGIAVGKLRNHAAKEVSALAKELVKKWRGEVDAAKGTKKPKIGVPAKKPLAGAAASVKSEATSTVGSQSPATPGASLPPTPVERKQSLPGQPVKGPRSTKSDGIKSTLGDKVRDKCLEMVYDALASDSGAPSDQIFAKAKSIEASVCNEFPGIEANYKNKMRRLFLNLKDRNNPRLRESIVSGEITASKFCQMTVQEMASEERRQADQQLNEVNLHNSLGAGDQEAETDAFKCGRCGQRKTRYRQAQTRSADEPMTTFVTCVNCNNRWKFS